MTSGVDFINVLRVAIAHADCKSAKKTDNLTAFLALSGSVHVKALCRILMKLTQGVKANFFSSDSQKLFLKPHDPQKIY